MINLPTPKNSGTPTLLPTKPHNQFPLIHIPNDQGWKPQFRTSVSKSLFENNSGICLWWRHISGETRCITFNYPSFFPVFFFFFSVLVLSLDLKFQQTLLSTQYSLMLQVCLTCYKDFEFGVALKGQHSKCIWDYFSLFRAGLFWP